jgi:pimeloyl-ACP methyl ester carboxylesterase
MTTEINKENHIKIDGKNLYYEFINKDFLSEGKPLLVFLHEGLGCSELWRDFPLLVSNATKSPVLLYDRYGYGKSEGLKENRTQDYMHTEALKTLPEFFKKLDLETYPKILIGHSDGGSIAIIYAGRFSENLKGIITEAAHLFTEEITQSGIKEVKKAFESGNLKRMLRKYHGEKTDSMFYGWADTWLAFEAGNWNIEEYLEGIKVPVLAIQGADDEYGSIKQLESIKKGVGSLANTELIPDCGHIPHFQSKDLVFKMITDFVAKNK